MRWFSELQRQQIALRVFEAGMLIQSPRRDVVFPRFYKESSDDARSAEVPQFFQSRRAQFGAAKRPFDEQVKLCIDSRRSLFLTQTTLDR